MLVEAQNLGALKVNLLTPLTDEKLKQRQAMRLMKRHSFPDDEDGDQHRGRGFFDSQILELAVEEEGHGVVGVGCPLEDNAWRRHERPLYHHIPAHHFPKTKRLLKLCDDADDDDGGAAERRRWMKDHSHSLCRH